MASSLNRGIRWARAVACVSAMLLLFAMGYIVWSGGVRQPKDMRVFEALEREPETEADGLTRYVSEREALREKHQRQLDEIIADETASVDTREAARRQRMEMLTWAEQELTIEAVLAARGFGRVAATVHADSVNVLVCCASLTQAQSATILELVIRETGQIGGNIKIIPIN